MTTKAPDLIIHNSGLVITCAGEAPRRGPDQGELAAVADGAVAVRGDKILAVGPQREILDLADRHTRMIDVGGRMILPGLVDPHTHPVYGGDRADEFLKRLGGVDYETLHAAGGGIQATVRATRNLTVADLVEQARPRLARMMSNGVTTFEAKSGYALDVPGELAMLQAVRELDQAGPWELVPTFMGAHTLPDEYKNDRRGFVDLVINEMLPQVEALKLAEFCDVFCERGAFDVDESREILLAGRSHGLTPKIHADELSASGGTELGVELGARSVDHLPYVSERGIELLADSDTVAVLLPATTFFLFKEHYAPGRRLVDAGAIVALASDHNPGSSHTLDYFRVLELAVMRCGLTVEEALVAATINAAYAVDRHDRIGSLEPGKQADLAITDVYRPAELIYGWGVNHVTGVVKRGKLINRRRSHHRETRKPPRNLSRLFHD
jgi:imidazolonepropionase